MSEQGVSLLARISTEMVRMQKQYWGRGPDRAKSYMLDDLLIIAMRGGFLTAERTMVERGQEDLVREFRQRFENIMGEQLVGMIEDLTGRKVVNYQSQILFDPDMVFEIFVFDERADGAQVRATAESQLGDGQRGEVRADEVDPDRPGLSER